MRDCSIIDEVEITCDNKKKDNPYQRISFAVTLGRKISWKATFLTENKVKKN